MQSVAINISISSLSPSIIFLCFDLGEKFISRLLKSLLIFNVHSLVPEPVILAVSKLYFSFSGPDICLYR